MKQPTHRASSFRHPILSALVALSLTAAVFGQLVAQSQSDPAGATAQENSAATIRHIVESANHPYLRWPDFPYYQDEMEAIYGSVDFAPLWFEAGSLSPPAHAVLDLLLEVDDLGLEPESYDAGRLQGIREELQGGRQLSPSEIGLVDAAISVAILRHISDVHIGRVNPENLSFGFNIEDKKYDLPKLLLDAIARNRIAETVREAEPDLPQYWRLKEALARYRALAENPDLGPVRVPPTVNPGDRYDGTIALRRYLAGLGDLSESDAQQAGGDAARRRVIIPCRGESRQARAGALGSGPGPFRSGRPKPIKISGLLALDAAGPGVRPEICAEGKWQRPRKR